MNEDELNLDLDAIETNVEQKLTVKNRFQQLSEKVKITAQEKEQALAKAKSEETARLSAEKDRDFYKDFSTHSSKYPNANEYQDKILEKVKSGYSTEDAMVSVLAKEGKLNMSATPAPKPSSQVEGGSAPTSLGISKSLSDMTIDEKFSALQDADKSGALSNALRGRN